MTGHKTNNRRPLQVSDKFLQRLKEMQKKMRMNTGNEVSLRALTEDIVSSPIFADIERSIVQNKNIKFDIKVKMDRRFFQ